MFQTHVFDGVDIQPLADACCRVLERVGVLCQNAEMLQALARMGCRADAARERVRFPEPLVRRFVEGLRAQGTQPLPQRPFGAGGEPGFGTQVAQVYYDYPSGERRGGNCGDLITCLKLGDVLHGGTGVGHCLVQTEAPARLESLETALVLAEYAQRPAPPFAWYADQIDYLREMGDILGIPNWFTYGATCFAHPLRFDRDVADKFVRRIREGGPAGLTAMPVAGMTTPVTVEGFIAVAAAEHVATWMAGRALDPACPLGGSMWSGTVDMRTGSVSYSTFDALFYGFACCEFLRLWTGRHLPVGGGEYCDAREPGTFAAMEKAWKAMTIAAFQGSHPSIGQGMLECGRTLCPVQVLLEQDFFHGLEQMAQTVQPTPDRIDLDGIADVDLGLTRSYLAGAGTLAHFRELWLPRFVPRSGWDGPRGDRLALDRARGRMDELLDAYRKPEGREDVLERLRAVVARARQRLL